MQPYQPRRQSRSRFEVIHGLRYHLREWGREQQPLLLMLHGWMDLSASFQFLVDALSDQWFVVAPDWRGFGLTEWSGATSYWAPDYLADLDRILDLYSPSQPARLVGHSMGGNVASIYSGVRPARVRSLVNLEGLGMAGEAAELAPTKLSRWLDQHREPPQLRDYADFEAVAARLQQTNPRLSDERAAFLASQWASTNALGRLVLRADPAHKLSSPHPFRASEADAIWACIQAPVLWVMARHSDYAKKMHSLPDYAERLARITTLERIWVEDAAHMLHHDQPQLLAQHIEGFLQRHGQGAADERPPARQG